jgi:hypothetical protein
MIMKLSIVHRESQAAREGIDRRVHVEAVEAQAVLARRDEECPNVASKLQPRSASAERSTDAARLSSRCRQLGCVERRESVFCGSALGVERRYLRRALDRIAIDEPAMNASHESKRRRLRERQPVREPTCRGVGPEAPCVVFPQRLHLRTQLIRVGYHRGIVSSADDTMRDLVRCSLHHSLDGFSTVRASGSRGFWATQGIL